MYSQLEVFKMLQKLARLQLRKAQESGVVEWIAYQEDILREADELVRQEEADSRLQAMSHRQAGAGR